MENNITRVCNICGKLPEETETKRLVRDHNHKTGYIRGLLCDPCNGRLGTYESTNSFIGKYRKKKSYRIWLTLYYNRIIYHLSCNTGVLYSYNNREKENKHLNKFKYKLPGSIPLPRLKRA